MLITKKGEKNLSEFELDSIILFNFNEIFNYYIKSIGNENIPFIIYLMMIMIY